MLLQVPVQHSKKLDVAFLAEFAEMSSWASVKKNAVFYEAERCAGRAGVKRAHVNAFYTGNYTHPTTAEKKSTLRDR